MPLTATQVEKLQHLLHASKTPYTLASHAIESTPEHIIWNKTPIAVYLPVGKERMIHFPGSVQVGYDKTILTDEHIRIQNNQGTLYLLAKKEFPAERIQVKLESGKIILLDVSAKKLASCTPLEIVVSEDKPISSPFETTEPAHQNQNPKSVEEDHSNLTTTIITPIQLTRFAAQQLYAPQRLLTQLNNIYRVPMHTKKTVDLVLDGSVTAMPLASWRGGDEFVTAILLRNNLPQTLTLHPQDLCGQWQTATFFPKNELAPRGNVKDSTTVFLVSCRPFAESLTAHC